jgi:hypothetical protein
MKAFPKTIYLKYEEDGDNSFFIASEDPADHAEVGGKVRVGVYELKVSTTVTAPVVVA